jgi:hypothetical protein
VAVTGDAAPGTAHQFYFPFGAPVISAQGRTAFTANLTRPDQSGGPNYSLWSESRTGALELIARQGTPAPGLPGGFTFSDDFRDPVINASGRIAFMARIEPDPTGLTWGIWAQDKDFKLRLIALTGFPVEGASLGGAIRPGTLAFVGGAGTQDGRRFGFNDLGQVAFRAGLTSGTEAAFVSNLAALSAADFDENGVVNAADLVNWLEDFGAPGDATHRQGDADRDLDVDGHDFLIWQRQLSGGTMAAVPEPHALLMVSACTLLGGPLRRKGH